MRPASIARHTGLTRDQAVTVAATRWAQLAGRQPAVPAAPELIDVLAATIAAERGGAVPLMRIQQELRGSLDADRLRAALTELVDAGVVETSTPGTVTLYQLAPRLVRLLDVVPAWRDALVNAHDAAAPGLAAQLATDPAAAAALYEQARAAARAQARALSATHPEAGSALRRAGRRQLGAHARAVAAVAAARSAARRVAHRAEDPALAGTRSESHAEQAAVITSASLDTALADALAHAQDAAAAAGISQRRTDRALAGAQRLFGLARVLAGLSTWLQADNRRAAVVARATVSVGFFGAALAIMAGSPVTRWVGIVILAQAATASLVRLVAAPRARAPPLRWRHLRVPGLAALTGALTPWLIERATELVNLATNAQWINITTLLLGAVAFVSVTWRYVFNRRIKQAMLRRRAFDPATDAWFSAAWVWVIQAVNNLARMAFELSYLPGLGGNPYASWNALITGAVATAATGAQRKWIGSLRTWKAVLVGVGAAVATPTIAGLGLLMPPTNGVEYVVDGLWVVGVPIAISVAGDWVIAGLRRLSRADRRHWTLRKAVDGATFGMPVPRHLRPFGRVLRSLDLWLGIGKTIDWNGNWRDIPRAQGIGRRREDSLGRLDWSIVVLTASDAGIAAGLAYLVYRPLPFIPEGWPTVAARVAAVAVLAWLVWRGRNRFEEWIDRKGFVVPNRKNNPPARARPFGTSHWKVLGRVNRRIAPFSDDRQAYLDSRDAHLHVQSAAPGEFALTEPYAVRLAGWLAESLGAQGDVWPELRQRDTDNADNLAKLDAAVQAWKDRHDQHRHTVAVGVLVIASGMALDDSPLTRLRASLTDDRAKTVQFQQWLFRELITEQNLTTMGLRDLSLRNLRRGQLEVEVARTLAMDERLRINFYKGPLRELHESRRNSAVHRLAEARRRGDKAAERAAEQDRLDAETELAIVSDYLENERNLDIQGEALVATRQTIAGRRRSHRNLAEREEENSRRVSRLDRVDLQTFTDASRSHLHKRFAFSLIFGRAQLVDEVELRRFERVHLRRRWRDVTDRAIHAPAATDPAALAARLGTDQRTPLDTLLVLAGHTRPVTPDQLAARHGGSAEGWRRHLEELRAARAVLRHAGGGYWVKEQLSELWRTAAPPLRRALRVNPTSFAHYPEVGQLTTLPQAAGYRALVELLTDADRAARYYRDGSINDMRTGLRYLAGEPYRREHPISRVSWPAPPEAALDAARADQAARGSTTALHAYRLAAAIRLVRTTQAQLRQVHATALLPAEVSVAAERAHHAARIALRTAINDARRGMREVGVVRVRRDEVLHTAKQVYRGATNPRPALRAAADAALAEERRLNTATRRLDHAGAHAVRRAAAFVARDLALRDTAAALVALHRAIRNTQKTGAIRESGVFRAVRDAEKQRRRLFKHNPELTDPESYPLIIQPADQRLVADLLTADPTTPDIRRARDLLGQLLARAPPAFVANLHANPAASTGIADLATLPTATQAAVLIAALRSAIAVAEGRLGGPLLGAVRHRRLPLPRLLDEPTGRDPDSSAAGSLAGVVVALNISPPTAPGGSRTDVERCDCAHVAAAAAHTLNGDIASPLPGADWSGYSAAVKAALEAQFGGRFEQADADTVADFITAAGDGAHGIVWSWADGAGISHLFTVVNVAGRAVFRDRGLPADPSHIESIRGFLRTDAGRAGHRPGPALRHHPARVGDPRRRLDPDDVRRRPESTPIARTVAAAAALERAAVRLARLHRDGPHPDLELAAELTWRSSRALRAIAGSMMIAAGEPHAVLPVKKILGDAAVHNHPARWPIDLPWPYRNASWALLSTQPNAPRPALAPATADALREITAVLGQVSIELARTANAAEKAAGRAAGVVDGRSVPGDLREDAGNARVLASELLGGAKALIDSYLAQAPPTDEVAPVRPDNRPGRFARLLGWVARRVGPWAGVALLAVLLNAGAATLAPEAAAQQPASTTASPAIVARQERSYDVRTGTGCPGSR